MIEDQVKKRKDTEEDEDQETETYHPGKWITWRVEIKQSLFKLEQGVVKISYSDQWLEVLSFGILCLFTHKKLLRG